MSKPPDPVLPRRQRATVTALIVLAVFAVCAAAKIAAAFLVPVVVGMLASYSVKPMVASRERMHVHRALGAGVVLLVLTARVAGWVFLLRDDAVCGVAGLPSAPRWIG